MPRARGGFFDGAAVATPRKDLPNQLRQTNLFGACDRAINFAGTIQSTDLSAIELFKEELCNNSFRIYA
ncbi:hypothetical protein JCM12107_18560 [Corynebacterium simulans]|nr:hypothetical protein HMPREF2888_11115 [Corynebacterium sp. HMSC077D03]